MNAAVPMEYQVLMALRFYTSASFQNSVSAIIKCGQNNSKKAIQKVYVALQRPLQQCIYLPRDQRETQY